jgi:hypothetical protein
MLAHSQQGVWRYWGRTLLASAMYCYQLQFHLDVNNLALVVNLNFLNNIGLQL